MERLLVASGLSGRNWWDIEGAGRWWTFCWTTGTAMAVDVEADLDRSDGEGVSCTWPSSWRRVCSSFWISGSWWGFIIGVYGGRRAFVEDYKCLCLTYLSSMTGLQLWQTLAPGRVRPGMGLRESFSEYYSRVSCSGYLYCRSKQEWTEGHRWEA